MLVTNSVCREVAEGMLTNEIAEGYDAFGYFCLLPVSIGRNAT